MLLVQLVAVTILWWAVTVPVEGREVIVTATGTVEVVGGSLLLEASSIVGGEPQDKGRSDLFR